MDHACFCILCFSCFRVCSLLPCGHLLGSADLFAFVGDVYCISVTFTCGILGIKVNVKPFGAFGLHLLCKRPEVFMIP